MLYLRQIDECPERTSLLCKCEILKYGSVHFLFYLDEENKHPPSRCFSINRWICIKETRPDSKPYFKSAEKNVHRKTVQAGSLGGCEKKTVSTTHALLLGSHSPDVQLPTHHTQGVAVFMSNWRCGQNDGICNMRIHTTCLPTDTNKEIKKRRFTDGCVKAYFFVPVSRLLALIMWHDKKKKRFPGCSLSLVLSQSP